MGKTSIAEPSIWFFHQEKSLSVSILIRFPRAALIITLPFFHQIQFFFSYHIDEFGLFSGTCNDTTSDWLNKSFKGADLTSIA